MSYLALARKYRPQTFDSLISQEFVSTTLKNAVTSGRVSHAYLFTGPRGVGKTSAARIFAKSLNCLNPKGAEPCGECENCVEITSGTSLDVIEIDGASNRGVDEIRSLREAVRFVPVKGKYKVYIVDEVHMLTKEAFNALLKTLEEPPEFVIFVFATTDSHKLPATIISRCQRYEFTRIPHDDMYGNLVSVLEAENVPYEEDALNLIIRRSDGCMRDALSILDQVIAYSGGRADAENAAFLTGASDGYLADDIFKAVVFEEPDKIPALAEEADKKGADYKYLAECLIERTRNALFLASAGKLPGSDRTAAEEEYYAEIARRISPERAYALFQIFQKLFSDLKYFDFPRYVFEFALFKAASLSRIIPVGSASVSSGAAAGVPLVKPEKVSIGPSAAALKNVSGSGRSNASKVKAAGPSSDRAGAFSSEEKNASPMPETVSEAADVTTDAPKNTGPLTSEDLWNRALAVLTKDPGPFGCNIQHGYLVSADERRIVVGFHRDRSFYYDFYSKPDKKKRVQDVLDSLASPAPRFETVLENETGLRKAPAEILMQAETYKERQAKKAARDEPLVKAAIESLGAEIESVDILGGREENE